MKDHGEENKRLIEARELSLKVSHIKNIQQSVYKGIVKKMDYSQGISKQLSEVELIKKNINKGANQSVWEKMIKEVLKGFEFEPPVVKIPEFKFPKISLAEIDYERIERLTNNNSQFGWTLTGSMSSSVYLDENLEKKNQKEIDAYFMEYYQQKDKENLTHLKSEILEQIEKKWVGSIEQCFEAYRLGLYQLTLPLLISIIEGEIASLLKTHKAGYPLSEMLDETKNDEEIEYRKIAIYSIVHCLQEHLFKRDVFEEQRNPLINRHRVMHGRDDPSNWHEVDFIRLLNILGSIQFVKTYFEARAE